MNNLPAGGGASVMNYGCRLDWGQQGAGWAERGGGGWWWGGRGGGGGWQVIAGASCCFPRLIYIYMCNIRGDVCVLLIRSDGNTVNTKESSRVVSWSWGGILPQQHQHLLKPTRTRTRVRNKKKHCDSDLNVAWIFFPPNLKSDPVWL